MCESSLEHSLDLALSSTGHPSPPEAAGTEEMGGGVVKPCMSKHSAKKKKTQSLAAQVLLIAPD